MSKPKRDGSQKKGSSVIDLSQNVSHKSDVSTISESFTSPQPNPRSVSSITPYTGTNIDTSYWNDTKVCTNESIQTMTCTGCNRPYNMCLEGKWRRICLHKVLDYVEAKDFDGATERGIRKVYYETFMMMMKAEILDKTDLYELEDHIHLPECMRSGSLNKALEFKQFDTAYEFMKMTRVHDVQHVIWQRGRVNLGITVRRERGLLTLATFVRSLSRIILNLIMDEMIV